MFGFFKKLAKANIIVLRPKQKCERKAILSEQLFTSTPNHSGNMNNNSDYQTNMASKKKLVRRIGTDVLILMCTVFPILLINLVSEPYKRGFFCDDQSLKHAFHDSTVTNWMLIFIGLVIPVVIVVTVEMSKTNIEPQSSMNHRYVFSGRRIPVWLIECYKKIGVFLFGVALCQLTTDIAKHSIGRLRPHFFNVCQPIMPDGTNCSNSINIGRYIENFTCLGVNSTQRMLNNVRLSFPSGHSSLSTFSMVYMVLYLQARINWKTFILLKHFIQFLLIMIAWYTSLSRVSDYMHHWSDVLAGLTIGAICALVVANFVSDLFIRSPKILYLPKTRSDISLPPIAIIIGHS